MSLGFALKIKQKRAWFLPGFSGYPEAPTGFMPVEPMILHYRLYTLSIPGRDLWEGKSADWPRLLTHR